MPLILNLAIRKYLREIPDLGEVPNCLSLITESLQVVPANKLMIPSIFSLFHRELGKPVTKIGKELNFHEVALENFIMNKYR